MREAVKRPAGYIILTLAGTVLLILFLIPLLMGIKNLGSILGSLISASAVLYSFLFDKVNSRVKDMWRRRAGKAFLVFCAVLAAACIICFAVTVCLMVSATGTAPAEEATAVVLGCQVRGDEPSLMLERRLEKAYEYLTENPDAACVLAGGRGDDENLSEAECMYRWLTARGISPDRLYVEDRSVNTQQNMRFSAEIIREKGLPTDIAVVTDGFHLYRGMFFAKNEGLNAGAVKVTTAWYLLPAFCLREAAAIFVRCILSRL